MGKPTGFLEYDRKNNEAVEFRGAVFNDEHMIRSRLEALKSEEIKLIGGIII